MSETLTMTVDKKDIDKIIKKLNTLNIKDRSNLLFKSIQNTGFMLTEKLKTNINGIILRKRSGGLHNSIQSVIKESSDNVILTVGSGVLKGNRSPQANIHELGGIVKPNSRQYLTLPLTGAMTSKGIARFTAGQLKAGQVSGYRGSFIYNKIIYGIKGASANLKSKVVPLFMLKKFVNMPPRYYLSRTLSQNKETIIETFMDAINKGLES